MAKKAERDILTTFVRAVMAAQGVSIGQLARDTGIDRPNLSRWLAGKGGISLERLVAVFRVLEVWLSTPEVTARLSPSKDVLGIGPRTNPKRGGARSTQASGRAKPATGRSG